MLYAFIAIGVVCAVGAGVAGLLGVRAARRKNAPLREAEARGGYVVRGLFFRNDFGHGVYIDRILLAQNGVWVISEEDCEGVLRGSAARREWTLTPRGGTSEAYPNPIAENETRAYHLARAIGAQDVCRDLVVFYDRADISRISSRKLCLRRDLNAILARDTGISLSEGELRAYRDALDGLKRRSKAEWRREKKAAAAAQRAVRRGICPQCGKRLVEKGGRYGRFYVCSRAPVCKFKLYPKQKARRKK